MRNYKPATFQPTIRPDWGGALSYIPDAEKSEILVALFKYPSVECSSRFWLETIKPDLDLQIEEFKRQCELKSRGIRERWGKTSITPLQDQNNMSIRGVIVPEREREEEKKKENNISLSGIRASKKQNLDLGEYSILQEQVFQWLEYKKSRKETYKAPNGPKMFAKKLWELSNGNPETATAIIEQSMANNWAGVFALKNKGPINDRRNIDDPEHFVI